MPDEFYYGKTIDMASGDLWRDGEDLTVGHLGATLMAAANIDPGDYLPGVSPVYGVLG